MKNHFVKKVLVKIQIFAKENLPKIEHNAMN